MKTSRRRKISPSRQIRWDFTLVIFFMFSVSVLLMMSAGNRFSGVAWGGLADWDYDESVSLDGFMVVDLSDMDDADLAAGFMKGAAYAAQFPENVFPVLPLPRELDASSALPKVENTDLGGLELPPSVRIAHLQLPMLVEEIGDFGPLPKDLEDFEAIVLNTTDDGLKLPDDFLMDTLPGMELPDDDIILAEVSVNWKEHVVKSGETLSDIVLMYGGITTQDVLRANELRDANRLSAQQILLIPNSPERIEDTLEEVRTRKSRVVAMREQVEPLKISSYVVAAGDSLWSIANSQNLEVDTLVGSNVFKTSVLQPGVVLRVPNQDGIFYTFKSGDKIDNVAKRYRVSVDKIKKVNPTTDLYSLKAGNEIFLPGARPEAVAEAQPKKTGNATSANKSGSSSSSRSLRWPVMGRINSPYGWRRHPITRRNDFHTGLDIKAARGTVIRSAGDGVVAYAGWMGGYGKVVVVQHANGRSTLYAHCSSILVSQGARVSSGQNIARVGSTGRTTGPHLHFEVRNGNSPVNPLPHMR
ncbi:MAG: LysM peptidoglycan-binding domain-containing M23 family metallopeptidase [Synergistaceae bacterium]|nr:LysM peptidoglycan-binding domain-containing M23 family metallopeptidase [Synergistaceae bacterium]